MAHYEKCYQRFKKKSMKIFKNFIICIKNNIYERQIEN